MNRLRGPEDNKRPVEKRELETWEKVLVVIRTLCIVALLVLGVMNIAGYGADLTLYFMVVLTVMVLAQVVLVWKNNRQMSYLMILFLVFFYVSYFYGNRLGG